MDISLRKLREIVIERSGMLYFMGSKRVGHDLVTEQYTTKIPQERKEEQFLLYQQLKFY